MAEYIKRLDALRIVNLFHGAKTAYHRICDILAADVAAVVHGRWLICSDGYYPYCSECKEEPYRKNNCDLPNYCPNCGAKMKDGE